MKQHADEQPATHAVTEFFAAIEAGQWDHAATLLADNVHIAHGPQGMTLSQKDLIARWKDSHAACSRTTYRLGPLHTEYTGQHQASVGCSARITMQQLGNLGGQQEVIVGTYTIDLHQAADTWKIGKIRHDEHRNEPASRIAD